MWIGGLPLLIAGVILTFAAGWWATAQMTAGSTDHDPSEIVIDEVAGQWVALLPLSYGKLDHGYEYPCDVASWIAAFVLFRLFDIWKPLVIGWADRRGDALGVMLDDIFAGIFALLGVIALAVLYHVYLFA